MAHNGFTVSEPNRRKEYLQVMVAKMTEAQMLERIQSLELQVANQPKPRAVSVKLSETTGSIVVSGLSGRFPTTLYRSSWKRLLTKEVASLILSFIKDNEAEITRVMAANGKFDR